MNEIPSGKLVIAYCHHLGAEAKANGRKYMHKDDRSDIATYAGFDSWNDIPTGMQKEAQKAFYSGLRGE